MNLIMNSPAALWSIVALTILIVGGVYGIYRAMK